ncbi:uncharacterized protein LOC134230454 [Saccostrea cucullata]|uniref:uncharacterized protein LOC134230454 n=1 Tax=Saccostrea cuccullata TaxID=36930 RepID=UPI002ED62198
MAVFEIEQRKVEFSYLKSIHKWNLTSVEMSLLKHFCQREFEELKSSKLVHIHDITVNYIKMDLRLSEGQVNKVKDCIAGIEEKLSKLWSVVIKDSDTISKLRKLKIWESKNSYFWVIDERIKLHLFCDSFEILKIKLKGFGIETRMQEPKGSENLSKSESMPLASAPGAVSISPKRARSSYSTQIGGNPATHHSGLKSYTVFFGPIKVQVYQKSILDVQVDAIVNAANERMEHIAGIAAAISYEAGIDFNNDCQRQLSVRGSALNPSDVLVTDPGKLRNKYKCILNAVGPKWDDYPKKAICLKELKDTMKNILKAASKKYCFTVAMPGISSGIFKVPLELCAKMYLLGIQEYVKEEGMKSFVSEIHLVDTDETVIKEIISACSQFQGDPDSITIESICARYPHLMKDSGWPSQERSSLSASQISSRRQHRTFVDRGSNSVNNSDHTAVNLQRRSGHSKVVQDPDERKKGVKDEVKVFRFLNQMVVKIYTGSIVKFSGDAIICSSDGSFSGGGVLARALETEGGAEYAANFDKMRPSISYTASVRAKPGDIKTCSAGKNLSVRFVIHAVIDVLYGSSESSLHGYQTTIKTILETINTYNKAKAFAIPLIGAGKIENSTEDLRKCCTAFFQVIDDFCFHHQSSCHIAELHLINKNPKITSALLDVFSCNSSKQTFSSHDSYQKQRERNERTEDFAGDHTRKRHAGSFHRQLSWTDSRSDESEGNNGYGIGARPKTGPRRTQSLYTKSFDSRQKQFKEDKSASIERIIAQNTVQESLFEKVETDKQKHSSKASNGNLVIIGLDEEDENSNSSVDETNANPGDDDKTTTCVICLDDIKNGLKLACGHEFCKGCLTQSFTKHKEACPVCGKIFGEITGNQPPGEMTVEKERRPLPGYEGVGTIVVKYKFNSGIQGPDHPNPGQPYDGTERRGFLPDNEEGRKVLQLLQTAFDRKLTFTIGYSRTTGKDNVVTWNDIHHKTKRDTGAQRFGYPDPTYLQRVQEELAAKGVTD